MSRREDLDKELKDLIELTKSVFGDVEDVGGDDIGEILSFSGSSPQEVSESFYRELKTIVEETRKRGEPVPERYIEALEQVRPISETTYNPKYMRRRARTWIGGMLQKAQVSSSTELVIAFRNKGDLSKHDEEVLEHAAERLKRRMRESEKK